MITLIRPPAMISKFADAGPLTPPIGPAYLASSLREAGFSVTIIDAIGENPFQVTPLSSYEGSMLAIGLTSEELVDRIPPESAVFGVSLMFSQDWLESRRMIQLVKARYPEIPILVGGEHPTALGEFLLKTTPEIDFCVFGEGEETLVDLVQTMAGSQDYSQVKGIAYRAGNQVVRTPARSRKKNVDDIPRPAWDLVPLENYLENGLGFGVNRGRSIPILATRGCPYQCTFCSNPSMWTTLWVSRDPAKVVEEIQDYIRRYRATNFDFYDLTAIIRKEWIMRFTDLIKQKGLKFTWQLPSGTRSEAIDREVSERLSRSGCRNMNYAPESGSESELKRIKKKINIGRIIQSMKDAVEVGINVKANIIIGLPDVTRREIWQTLGFTCRMAWIGVHDTAIVIFSPYPGSELFDLLRKRGRIQELDEAYFLSLAGYKDYMRTVSYADGISSAELSFYRILGMGLFYFIQYVTRPWRFFKTVRNFLTHKQESRLDQALRSMVDRLYRVRRSASQLSNG